MKRISAFAVLIVSLVFAAAVFASPSPVGGNGQKACSTSGTQLVNVHYTLVNDYDSATDGHSWANDTITRQLQIWQVGNDLFCVSISDQGSFVTFAGTSPNGTGTVSAGITGKIKGGETSTVFGGTFAPLYPTNGYLGRFDQLCGSSDGCQDNGPSYLRYFSTISGNAFAVWGWSYHTASNGDWANASTGNLGDITG